MKEDNQKVEFEEMFVVLTRPAPDYDGGGRSERCSGAYGPFKDRESMLALIAKKQLDCGRGEGCCWKSKTVADLEESELGFFIAHMLEKGHSTLVIRKGTKIVDPIPASWCVLERG